MPVLMNVLWITWMLVGLASWFWLATAAVSAVLMAYAGGRYFRGAWRSLRAHHANMDTLIALGTGAAWAYSTVVAAWPTLVPSGARHPYFEAALVIIALINLGQALELRARGRASSAIRRLVGLRPRTARVVRDGEERERSIAELRIGEHIRVRPGERAYAVAHPLQLAFGILRAYLPLLQIFAQLLTGVDERITYQRSGARGGRHPRELLADCVDAHFNQGWIQPRLVAHNLQCNGVHALPHFRPAVIDTHAIGRQNGYFCRGFVGHAVANARILQTTGDAGKRRAVELVFDGKQRLAHACPALDDLSGRRHAAVDQRVVIAYLPAIEAALLAELVDQAL